MLSYELNRKVFLASSWYDLAISAPFALPVTFALVWSGVMTPLHATLGLGELEVLGAHGVLFANFFGSVVTIWAIVRLKLADIRLAFYDGIGRGLFSLAMVNALMDGASPWLWAFLIPEMAFCVLQLLGTASLRQNRLQP